MAIDIQQPQQDEASAIDLSKWIKEQLDAEIARVKSAGANPLPLTVTRTCVEIDWTRPRFPVAANQLEVKTNFPFDNIKEILVSDPIPCPLKDGFCYVNVVLFTDKPIPLMLPYVYDSKLRASSPPSADDSNDRKVLVRNKLDRWIFINQKGQRSYHRIDQFSEI